jgi:hypothetical protein
LQIPIDRRLKEIIDIPYTISYVIRKRMQIDGFNELSKDKRPTTQLIFDGTSEEIESWLDDVIKNKTSNKADIIIDNIEGE